MQTRLEQFIKQCTILMHVNRQCSSIVVVVDGCFNVVAKARLLFHNMFSSSFIYVVTTTTIEKNNSISPVFSKLPVRMVSLGLVACTSIELLSICLSICMDNNME